jgi:hypothetical protein
MMTIDAITLPRWQSRILTCSFATSADSATMSVKDQGSTQVHEIYVGLANMAMANIVVHQEHHIMQLDRSQIPAIKRIVGFLQCALEKPKKNGILFRVYDVLYALDSLSKAHEPNMIGIKCGLVDLAVQVTAEWNLSSMTERNLPAKLHASLQWLFRIPRTK